MPAYTPINYHGNGTSHPYKQGVFLFFDIHVVSLEVHAYMPTSTSAAESFSNKEHGRPSISSLPARPDIPQKAVELVFLTACRSCELVLRKLSRQPPELMFDLGIDAHLGALRRAPRAS